MILSGNAIGNVRFYLLNIRYIFIPTSILLTFVISNLSQAIININRDKIRYIISLAFIIIISAHYFIFNFLNPSILPNLNWKEFSSVYSNNGKDSIFIPVNPGGHWGVNVNANNIQILNDFYSYSNKLYISDINVINSNSFLYFVMKDYDLSIIGSRINAPSNNDTPLQLNDYRYNDKYYFISLQNYRNIKIIINLRNDNYNDILNNFRIIQKIY